MTRFVGEPNSERKGKQGVWGVEDLRKRPAPVAADASTPEWIKLRSTTDLGTTFTALDWTTTADSSYNTGTFDLNGNSNLTIGVDGMYDLSVYIYAKGASSPNQVEVHILRGYRKAGATPITFGAGSFVSPREVRLLYRYDDTTVLDSGNLQTMPDWYTPLAYFDGDIASDGITEIEFEAYVEINGAGTATTDLEFSLFCRKIGGPGIF